MAKKLVGNTANIGILAPIGHVDFYPNGGEIQPGCWITDWNINPTCNHNAAFIFFMDSIKNTCEYQAYPCSGTDDYYQGDCLKCGPSGCNQMGYYASLNKDQDVLYLDTQSVYVENNCLQNYQVKVTSSDVGNKKAKGKFTMYLKNSKESSSTEILENGNAVFESNSKKRFLLSLSKPLNNQEITSAFITYKRGWNIFGYESKWQFSQIEILFVNSSKSIKFCPIESVFGLSETIEYSAC